MTALVFFGPNVFINALIEKSDTQISESYREDIKNKLIQFRDSDIGISDRVAVLPILFGVYTANISQDESPTLSEEGVTTLNELLDEIIETNGKIDLEGWLERLKVKPDEPDKPR